MHIKFNDALHTEVQSEDGSFTAYSEEYAEHYHSTKDGALKESYEKHVIPALKALGEKEEICILDICYGLGFNTLCTLLYYKENAPQTKLKIYSPELDRTLVHSLKNFNYPLAFEPLKHIINAISECGVYEDESVYVEVFLGNAREYVCRFEDCFDIVYQDAFSPSANPMLWTQEYFSQIKKSMKKNAVLTTYSISLSTRLALYKNDFKIYLNEGAEFRSSTVAAFTSLEMFKSIDMEHKIMCNPNATPLRD